MSGDHRLGFQLLDTSAEENRGKKNEVENAEGPGSLGGIKKVFRQRVVRIAI